MKDSEVFRTDRVFKEPRGHSQHYINFIYVDEADPKVSSLMKKQGFFLGLELGKNNQGIKEFPKIYEQNTRERLGYVKSGKNVEPKGFYESFQACQYKGEKEDCDD